MRQTKICSLEFTAKRTVLIVLATLGLLLPLLVFAAEMSGGASISKSVPIDAGEWSEMHNETIYARNFEHKIKAPKELHHQVVTIYDLAMTDDRRVGRRETKNEYIEIFKYEPMPTNHVVVQIRVDKGNHWILSRQTFIVDRFLDKNNPEESESSYQIFRKALQSEIDSTRYQLKNNFN